LTSCEEFVEWDNEFVKVSATTHTFTALFFLAVQDSATPKSLFFASTTGRCDAGFSKLKFDSLENR